MSAFKPMLASPADLAALRFPLLASPKLDGIRASVVDGKLLSRTLKPIPNKIIYSVLSKLDMSGLDGELIVGQPTDKDVYRNTVSGVMGVSAEADWTYYVFDDFAHSDDFEGRLARSARRAKFECDHARVTAHEHLWVSNSDDLLVYEAECVTAGFEGLILRDPRAGYKFGRSTTKEGWMLKLKRFEDGEAEITGVQEEQHNGNVAGTNELGRTQRSTARAGKVGKGTMGALEVRDIKSGVEFNIGTGFTATDRAAVWKLGDIVKYKHFPIGAKDKPRHPVYLGKRDRIDL